MPTTTTGATTDPGTRSTAILALVEGRNLSRGQIGMAVVDPGRPVRLMFAHYVCRQMQFLTLLAWSMC